MVKSKVLYILGDVQIARNSVFTDQLPCMRSLTADCLLSSLQTLFASPVPTPSSCAREGSLIAFQAQLEARLAGERREQAAVARKLAAGPGSAEVRRHFFRVL